MFRALGACVIDCDRLAHEAYSKRHAPEVYRKIGKLFELQKPTRLQVAARVFQNPPLRRKLEALIHPYVGKRIEAELRRISRGIVIIEVPLLFESGFDRGMDRTVTVSAPLAQIVKRLQKKGFSKEEINRRQKAQFPLRVKVNRADFVIHNSGTADMLRRNVSRIWKRLKEELE